MGDLEIRGAYPQKAESGAGEVVLTRAESAYLSLVLAADTCDPDFPPSPSEITQARTAASLTPKQSDFIRAWVKYKGDLFDLTDVEHYEPGRLARYLASPAVYRILTEASKHRAELPPPIPTKEELAVTWGMVSRDNAMPLGHQKEARQELAKLLGYYPNGSDGVNVGVQVILKGDLTLD